LAGLPLPAGLVVLAEWMALVSALEAADLPPVAAFSLHLSQKACHLVAIRNL